MDKFKEMEKVMEDRVRHLETRVENIDKQHDRSQPAPQRPDRFAFDPEPEVPSLRVHVKALEVCSDELLEHMLPHIDAILTEMERRVPAIYLPPLTPPAAGEASQTSSATPEAAQPTPAKRNKPPKRNRRPTSGNFTPMSVDDTPLSPSVGQSPSPSSVTPPTGQNPLKTSSNWTGYSSTKTTGDSPLSAASVTTTSASPFTHNNPFQTSVPRSSAASSGGQTISQATDTTAATKSTNGQNPLKTASNWTGYSSTKTTVQNPLSAASVTSTSTSPFIHNNPFQTSVPRSSSASVGSQTVSQTTVTTATTKSTNGITPSRTNLGSSVHPNEASGTLHDPLGGVLPKQTPLKNATVLTRVGSVAPMQASQLQSDTGGPATKLLQNAMSSNKAVPLPEVSQGDSPQIPSQPAAVTSEASVRSTNAFFNPHFFYLTNASGQRTLTSTIVNLPYVNTYKFVGPRGRVQLQQAQSQTPLKTTAPSTGLPTPSGTKPPHVGIQAGQLNTPRATTAPTPSQPTTLGANTIAQLSSTGNVITTPSVTTTSTGAIPRLVAAPSGWLEPLQPQLTESALTAQRLAHVRNSSPVTPNGTSSPQTTTLGASSLSASTTERQTIPSSVESLAAAIDRLSTSTNIPSVSGTDHSGHQASSFVEPSTVSLQPIPSYSSGTLQPGVQQPTPISSLSSPHPTTSSQLSSQPEIPQIPGPTALPSQQTPATGIQTNPSAAAPTFTPTTRPSILKDESSASTHDPFAQPKQVRFAVPPSPTADHPLSDEPPAGEWAERAALPLSFTEATDLLKSSAISGRAEDVVRALDGGASVDAADAHGQRALHWAAWCDHARVVELLVRRGAELELRNDLGLTPLHMAARGGSAQCAAFLLDAGVAVDARANSRRSALHLAAAKGCDAVVQVLLAGGADKGLLDAEGKTAFDLAITDDIRELLIY